MWTTVLMSADANRLSYLERRMKEMVKYENECVGCPPEMGCIGSACPNRNVKYLYCDKCGDDAEKLYVVDGKEICEDCLHKMFDTIE